MAKSVLVCKMYEGMPDAPAAGKQDRHACGLGPVSVGRGKSQPGLKELRDEVRASRTAAQTVDRQSLGPIPRGWGSGWREEGEGQGRLLGRGIPEDLGCLTLNHRPGCREGETEKEKVLGKRFRREA